MDDATAILFHNCKILTVDKNFTIAEAMGIHKNKIIAVGTRENVISEIKRVIGENSNEKIKIIEKKLNGDCIVPGFIDAHLHPVIYIYFKTQLILAEVKSYFELKTVLEKEDKERNSEEWIVGLHLMEKEFKDPTERRFPDKYDLDAICPNRPVIIIRYDGHICSVNSSALNVIGIDKSNVKDIKVTSGEIRTDANGEPTGILTEGAMTLAQDHVPLPSGDRLKKACEDFSDELASFGITTIGTIVQLGEVGIAGKAGTMELPAMEMFIKEGLIKQDQVLYLVTDKPKKIKRIQKMFRKYGEEDNKIVVAGIKIFADGSIGAQTACMYEPFTDSLEGLSGLMVNEKEELHRLFKEANELGLQVACHAIGDKANRNVVDLFKEIMIQSPKDENLGKGVNPYKHRIEHASLITNNILKDAASLGLIIVTQPAFINSEYTWLEKRLGQRVKYVYPFKSIIDSGVLLAGASDAPVESADVLGAIQVAITRNEFVPEQSISFQDALRMFTINAAHALGQENIKGSLEAGKLADFVILERDISSINSNEIGNTKVLATYHRGKKIYP